MSTKQPKFIKFKGTTYRLAYDKEEVRKEYRLKKENEGRLMNNLYYMNKDLDVIKNVINELSNAIDTFSYYEVSKVTSAVAAARNAALELLKKSKSDAEIDMGPQEVDE
jgi:hypothetical protein